MFRRLALVCSLTQCLKFVCCQNQTRVLYRNGELLMRFFGVCVRVSIDSRFYAVVFLFVICFLLDQYTIGGMRDMGYCKLLNVSVK